MYKKVQHRFPFVSKLNSNSLTTTQQRSRLVFRGSVVGLDLGQLLPWLGKDSGGRSVDGKLHEAKSPGKVLGSGFKVWILHVRHMWSLSSPLKTS